jgi:hypothetical protein
VHYSAGLAGLAAIGGAATLPGSGVLWLTARLLLDGAGALFGLYLLILVTLFLSGYVMRLRRQASPRDRTFGEAGARQIAASEPARR